MNIGAYTFEEFRALAENFHGYAAPGVLVGAYMVELGKRLLPEGTLFEAVAESAKCLPDAVQLLTACSTGNQRLKIHNLGRYAVSLFDKHSGEGVRVSLDPEKMAAYPELTAWFFKQKPKREQDVARLEAEIRTAGDSICKTERVRIHPRFMGTRHADAIGRCPVCGEAYPLADGPICRGCQGEAPYDALAGAAAPAETGELATDAAAGICVVPVEEAVGKRAAHDMTRIVPGQFKGPE
ncbi:MAG: formylmethanofuran dehydrogenase subunit E family protein, partial [Desulfovibrio sp.]|nr:formylmethanofuran dehydrogenase subunit E family protein [Desulfovibrio sp.]